MRKPLVSVVLIFLDAGEFLADAIESVFDQTHEHWELLLVDDGSSDGSTELARAVAREHPLRVTYVEHVGHANRGPSASRNAGIRAARGEYVAFLDADDVWQPRKLAEQVAILEKHPAAGLVYGAAVYWNSWRDPEVPDFRRALGVEENRLYPPTVLLTGALRSRVPTPCPSVVLVRRGLAVEVGGFDDGLHPFEDQAFLAKVYLRVPVYVAGESWILYRQHPASAVARMTAAGSKYDAGLAVLRVAGALPVRTGRNPPPSPACAPTEAAPVQPPGIRPALPGRTPNGGASPARRRPRAEGVMTESVTVVMTCLDSERFVEEAIESVLAQIYDDWRLVVVDDGSEDGTPRLLHGYAERHPDRILVVAHPGKATRGMSASRNLAVRHAAGKYVAFLDADDVWLPSKLEEQVTTLSSFPQAAMIFGAAESWHSWDRSSRNDDGAPEFLFEVDRLWAPPHLVPQILRGERPTTTVGLVRRWVVSHVGGFEERFRGLLRGPGLLCQGGAGVSDLRVGHMHLPLAPARRFLLRH